MISEVSSGSLAWAPVWCRSCSKMILSRSGRSSPASMSGYSLPRKFLHREQHPGPRGPQDVCRLAPLEAGVDRHEDRARTDHPECGDHPRRRVGRPDPDPVSWLDPYGDRRSRYLERAFGELGEAETEITVDDGFVPAETLGGVCDEAGDRAPPEVPPGIVLLLAVWAAAVLAVLAVLAVRCRTPGF